MHAAESGAILASLAVHSSCTATGPRNDARAISAQELELSFT